MLKSMIYSGAAALGLALCAPASAATVELGLAIDDSGSISSANFLLQKSGYVAALSDPTVLPLDGSVAIGVVKFSSSVVNVFTTQQITSANIGALIAALNGMTQSGGSTNIAGAIATLTTQITTNAFVSDRQVIDVSTDGENNVGNLALARSNALSAGIDQINCLGIGAGANCGAVQAGAGSFSVNATFGNFEASLRRKIQIEVSGGVPEPATWAMMILGFAVVGGALRRRRVGLPQLV
ncbi:MAG: hypothetical protein DI544_13360 [Sphingomonas taxi]|uniref:VWFA domain-containing protein n=1 Tax=Sphingomonas taxi TaxID=1549858 RepID=A0A2W5NZ39_9SPHN|nr:MAG: hypothetical protein DI544_13360 [Sphingomonas taxi]